MSVHHNSAESVEAIGRLNDALLAPFPRHAPPRDEAIGRLVREIRCGKTKPMEHAYLVTDAAIRARKPRAVVERPAREWLAHIALRYRDRTIPRPLGMLHKLETQLDNALDLSQVRVLTEDSVAAYDDAIERLDDLYVFLPELRDALVRKRAEAMRPLRVACTVTPAGPTAA